MILNFEAEIGFETYDVDVEVTYVAGYTGDGEPTSDSVVKILEVRLVGSDGVAFTVLDPARLSSNLVEELKKRALAERDWRVEADEEHRAESWEGGR